MLREILKQFLRSLRYIAFLIRTPYIWFYFFVNTKPIKDITKFEWKVLSEDGEDGILQAMLYKMGILNSYCVEFGCGDGMGCNTGLLVVARQWKCLHMDMRPDTYKWVRHEKVTAENVNQLFAKYHVPQEFDVLSIDLDFNDYWVWKALQSYSPRIVVIEYNASVPHDQSRTVEYDPNAVWDGSNYFGGSLLAMVNLGKAKGYTLVGCNSKGVNAFFVRDDLIEGNFLAKDISQIYRPPQYGEVVDGEHIGHPVSERKMVPV